MIVLTFEHPRQFEFLKHVFEAYTRGGLPADELPLAADTYLRMINAQDIPVQQNLGKAYLGEVGPGGFTLNLSDEGLAGESGNPPCRCHQAKDFDKIGHTCSRHGA